MGVDGLVKFLSYADSIIITRKFTHHLFHETYAGVFRQAPGRTSFPRPGLRPRHCRPVHRRDEDVMVEDDPQRMVALSTPCCKLVVKLNSNWAWHQSVFNWRSDFSKAWFDFSYFQAWERLFAVGSADRLFVLEKMLEVEMLHRNSAPVEI